MESSEEGNKKRSKKKQPVQSSDDEVDQLGRVEMPSPSAADDPDARQKSVVVEGVDIDAPEHENNMRKRAFDDEDPVEEQAEVVTNILWPVAITMILSIIVIKILSQSGSFVSNSLVFAESSNQSGGERFLGSLINALVFVAVILVVTIIFVILYKYRCLKVIYGWLILSTVLLLGFFGGLLAWEVVSQLNLALDWFTMSIVVWNFAIVGIISIFWHAHVRVNQLYLIAISVIMAVVFTRLPEWTTWLILAAIAIYDLFAVLTPCGPLKKLVETAQERNETIPALVFHTSVWLGMAMPDEEVGENDTLIDDEDEEIPHSRAALFDILTVFTCFVAVITGLFFTILLLAFWKKALPALPISIFFGILFFFASRFFLFPFAATMAVHGIVV